MNFLHEKAKSFTDSRIKFRRVCDDSIYCVMEPATMKRYRKAGTLDSFLQERRESGVVIRPING